MSQKPRNIVIIGLGSFGLALARELTRMGDRVLGIDIDAKPIQSICDELDSALQADASDIKALKQCGLENYDSTVISIGEDLEASLLAAVNVLELKCPEIWVKAQTPTHEKILRAVGITNVVQPEESYGLRLAQFIHNPLIKDFLNLGYGYYITQIAVQHTMAEKRVEEIKRLKKHNVKCVGVAFDNQLISPEKMERPLQTTDTLLLHGKRIDLRHFADNL